MKNLKKVTGILVALTLAVGVIGCGASKNNNVTEKADKTETASNENKELKKSSGRNDRIRWLYDRKCSNCTERKIL